MTLTFAALAVITFAVGFLLKHKKRAKGLVLWLWLIAGFGITGTIGAVLARLTASATSGTTSATAQLLGTAVPFLLAVLTLVYLGLHMLPKGQPPTRFTPWIALACGPILYAAGGVFTQAAGLGEDAMAQLTTATWATLTQFIASL